MEYDETRDSGGEGPSGLASTAPGSEQPQGDATILPLAGAAELAALPAPGYQLGAIIGRGGMGEVIAAHDQRIGREVAIKRIRARAVTPELAARFLREARIQARLDHPAIVPVYELGADADGLPYFTMKRLAGETLAQRVAAHAPIQPLLRAFVDVCLAVELAHTRGIIHRDLKPANIMLGDYGEVYVLDWGVARVAGDAPSAEPASHGDLEGTTASGALLGTPGYMAPEQIEGHEVGPAADVYALGAILFEILVGAPLHPRGEAALASTLTRPQQAPAERAGDHAIAPELDAACSDALAQDPARRPTARAFADRVQAYLDGDRDLARRRTLAAEQLVAAREALEVGGDDARATAMRRAGRALALDPESAEAAELVSSLVLEPPAELPPDLVKSLEDEERAAIRERSGVAFRAYLAGTCVFLASLLTGVKNLPLALSFTALLALVCVNAIRAHRTGRARFAVLMTLNFLVILVFSRVAGPLLLTPIVTLSVILSFTASPWMLERMGVLIAWTVLVVVAPLALEWTGLFPHSWGIQGGVIVTTSDIYPLRGAIDELGLVGLDLGLIMVALFFAIGINRTRYAAQRRLHIQAWHLRQLLPWRRRRLVPTMEG